MIESAKVYIDLRKQGWSDADAYRIARLVSIAFLRAHPTTVAMTDGYSATADLYAMRHPDPTPPGRGASMTDTLMEKWTVTEFAQGYTEEVAQWATDLVAAATTLAHKHGVVLVGGETTRGAHVSGATPQAGEQEQP